MSHTLLSEQINRMRLGETVICPKCGKGVLTPVGGDVKKAHVIKCDQCSYKIIKN